MSDGATSVPVSLMRVIALVVRIVFAQSIIPESSMTTAFEGQLVRQGHRGTHDSHCTIAPYEDGMSMAR